jgi:hypothetical protein
VTMVDRRSSSDVSVSQCLPVSPRSGGDTDIQVSPDPTPLSGWETPEGLRGRHPLQGGVSVILGDTQPEPVDLLGRPDWQDDAACRGSDLAQRHGIWGGLSERERRGLAPGDPVEIFDCGECA